MINLNLESLRFIGLTPYIAQQLRLGDDRGRHTTTSRSLHFCTNGACIIDTPGLRTWSPDTDEESLDLAFEDIAHHAINCKFRDCQHKEEPGCAVRGILMPTA